ncbi:MAG: hypothetical protein SOX56_09700 [[Pasteurella] mairii]|uniref:Transmembrane protein n=1 Tax=[Pasteurella] mairii TaxID=757 RepID=A0A379B884_9PAST|nr:hypothetical protein [[Pasteurella] mairii]SUB34448.1 Uncharacterised protein [[Pasteurella] mairii]
MKIHSKTRKVLTALFIGVLIFLSVLLLGVVWVIYMPGLNLNRWLQKTANYWLMWRIFLYSLMVALLYQIYRYRPLSRHAMGLIVLVILVFEGLNLLYRL